MPLILNLKKHRGREGKYYVLKRTLHITGDGQIVEETDPAGVTVLGGAGAPVSEEDVKKYGLDESHLESVPEPAEPEQPAEAPPEPEPPPPEAPAEQAAAVEPEPVSDELPEDFPGYAALTEAGIHTYAQVRATENLIEISGIGPVTVEKIAERLSER